MKRPRLAEIKEEVLDEKLETGKMPKKGIKSEELKCELCDTICTSISTLQSHTLSEHLPSKKTSSSSPSSPSSSSPPKVCCQQCDATFDSFARFASHMKTHLFANSGGSGASPLTSSNGVNVTMSSPIFYCPMCPLMTFHDATQRLEHLTIQHLQIRLPQHVCSECESSFVQPSALAAHFAQAHLRLKFECLSCSFVADSEKCFKDHSKKHSRQEFLFGCAACGCTFQSQNLLITHVQLCHDHESSFFPRHTVITKPKVTFSSKTLKTRTLQCSVCDESVIGEDGLDEHRLLRHCKVRYADKCADCYEKIETETDFVDHCARHTKELTIHCPICRQTLRSETQIHAHKTYHMCRPKSIDSSPQNVDICNNEEGETDSMKFTFVCPICGEKFDDALNLIEHSKCHDPIDDQPNSKKVKS